MNHLKHLLILAACALALPSPAEIPTSHLEARVSDLTDEGTTIDSPYYLHKWAENVGEVNVIDGLGSKFDVQWKSSGDFVGGKGWKVGTDRTIFYNGTHNSNSHSFVGIYGWTTNPLVEYFVVDSFVTRELPFHTLSFTTNGINNPAAAARRYGTLTTDGGTYAVYKSTRYNQPSLDGSIKTFDQYWSVRLQRRVGGQVTMKNHLDYWASLGFPIGDLQYQIVAVRGYFSTGTASLFFREQKE